MPISLPETIDVKTAGVLDTRCVGTTAGRSAITNFVAQGLLRYETDNGGQWVYYDGTDWQPLISDTLPTQTGNANKFLTTDGTTASWDVPDSLPTRNPPATSAVSYTHLRAHET